MNYLKATKDSIYPEIFLASLFCRASRDLLESSSPEMLDSLSQTFGEKDSNKSFLRALRSFAPFALNEARLPARILALVVQYFMRRCRLYYGILQRTSRLHLSSPAMACFRKRRRFAGLFRSRLRGTLPLFPEQGEPPLLGTRERPGPGTPLGF